MSHVPYADFVGLTTQRLDPDRARLVLPPRLENTNRNGTLHGGVIASALSMGATLAAAVPDGCPAELAIQFVTAAREEQVVIDATVVRRGRGLVFVEIEVTTGPGSPVARALAAVRPPGTRVVQSRFTGAGGRVPLAGVDDSFVAGHFSGSPYTARLGVQVAVFDPGHAAAILPWQPALGNGQGCLHEGALGALVDSAAGAAAWSVGGGFDRRGRAATVSMHLAFGAGACGEDAVAEALVGWEADGLCVATVTVTGRRTRAALATGQVTYLIARPEELG